MSKKEQKVTLSSGTFEALSEGAIKTDRIKAGQKVKMTPQKVKTNLTYFMSLPTHKELKQLALDHNTSLQQLVDEAIDDLFAKYGRPPLVPIPKKDEEI